MTHDVHWEVTLADATHRCGRSLSRNLSGKLLENRNHSETSRLKNNNIYNNNSVPGPVVVSKKSSSSNQRRHTQGREKRRPSTLMLREIRCCTRLGRVSWKNIWCEMFRIKWKHIWRRRIVPTLARVNTFWLSHICTFGLCTRVRHTWLQQTDMERHGWREVIPFGMGEKSDFATHHFLWPLRGALDAESPKSIFVFVFGYGIGVFSYGFGQYFPCAKL